MTYEQALTNVYLQARSAYNRSLRRSKAPRVEVSIEVAREDAKRYIEQSRRSTLANLI